MPRYTQKITALLQSGVTLPELKAYTGLSMGAIEHYIGHVGVKRVGVLLQKEVGQQ